MVRSIDLLKNAMCSKIKSHAKMSELMSDCICLSVN